MVSSRSSGIVGIFLLEPLADQCFGIEGFGLLGIFFGIGVGFFLAAQFSEFGGSVGLGVALGADSGLLVLSVGSGGGGGLGLGFGIAFGIGSCLGKGGAGGFGFGGAL